MAGLFISVRDKVGQLQLEVEARSLGQLSEASIALGYAKATCLPHRQLWHQYCGNREEKATSSTWSVSCKGPTYYTMLNSPQVTSDYESIPDLCHYCLLTWMCEFHHSSPSTAP